MKTQTNDSGLKFTSLTSIESEKTGVCVFNSPCWLSCVFVYFFSLPLNTSTQWPILNVNTNVSANVCANVYVNMILTLHSICMRVYVCTLSFDSSVRVIFSNVPHD